jgi:hypothetical protein
MKRTAPLALGLFLVTLAAASPAAARSEKPFSEVDPASVQLLPGERMISPRAARLVTLDQIALGSLLERMPAEKDAPRGTAAAELVLPRPDGGTELFRLVDSPVMAPELAARYPEIRTFLLIGVDRPELRGRGDLTPQGFHAVVRGDQKGMFYVDPLRRGDSSVHQIYWRRDLPRPTGENAFKCLVDDHVDEEAGFNENGITATGADLTTGAEATGGPGTQIPNGGLDLRTYRLALAATGEYTTFHGGTVPAGMAAIVVAVNRVNEVYEQDVAIRMILVPNNDLVVYTNGGTDPYTNNNGGTMLGQNTTNLNNVIGSANYDIGHVFSTGGGGVATLNGPCGGSKARGVTGLPSPTGDAFYIDFVAHEMGHQWGGNHTFNGNAGNCAGNISSAAYEPGSGTTIMAYAGICGNQDILDHSDPYFHRKSLDEIQTFSRTGNGNTCASTVAVGNALPTVEAGANYTIPIGTPFILTGSGADSDGSGTLNYCWEQYDLGPSGHPNTPSGNAPIFRSFNPTTSPSRTFPQVSDLVNNTQTIGEILPSYARNLAFRLTVRDMDLPAGANAWDSMSITVAASTGPFLVTAPNTAITWNGGGPHSVTWNVANTNIAPINCTNVDIKLSTDGGVTFPTTLLAAAPNNGAASVNVGTADTTTARVQVICTGNIFFDISNANFSITGATGIFEDGFESGDTTAWSQTTP